MTDDPSILCVLDHKVSQRGRNLGRISLFLSWRRVEEVKREPREV